MSSVCPSGWFCVCPSACPCLDAWVFARRFSAHTRPNSQHRRRKANRDKWTDEQTDEQGCRWLWFWTELATEEGFCGLSFRGFQSSKSNFVIKVGIVKSVLCCNRLGPEEKTAEAFLRSKALRHMILHVFCPEPEPSGTLVLRSWPRQTGRRMAVRLASFLGGACAKTTCRNALRLATEVGGRTAVRILVATPLCYSGRIREKTRRRLCQSRGRATHRRCTCSVANRSGRWPCASVDIVLVLAPTVCFA